MVAEGGKGDSKSPDSRATSTESGFYVAPYAIDGERVGLGYWKISRLSRVWLEVCNEFLNAHGDVFDISWGGKLNDIQTKLTSAAGSAISTFLVRKRVALSVLLLSGQSPETDHSATELLVESLLRIRLVQDAATLRRSFDTIVSTIERPLMVVVPWPDDEITDQERDVARELSIHLAGAFFSKNGALREGD